jgi:O-antigen biosynthesis protein
MSKPLTDAAYFRPHSMEYPDAWVGHIPFAAWLVAQFRPSTLVELGTHSGNSYFSFCQAVFENKLTTRCYAVDTWKGDEHAGEYSEEIFRKVNLNNQQYARFSTLVRSTFEEAVDYFADSSIDLLHIDGLHTYEAVRSDFETWLPKLAPGAIVLFHDTNVRRDDFGVWKLWDELKQVYTHHLEFSHCYGLGVLQLNNAPESKVQPWLQNSLTTSDLLRYFSALGEHQTTRYAATDYARRLEESHLALHQAHLAKDAQIYALQQTLEKTNIQINDSQRQIEALQRSGSEKDQQNIVLKQLQAQLDAEKAALIDNLKTNEKSAQLTIDEKDEQINELARIHYSAVAQLQIQISELAYAADSRAYSIRSFQSSTSWKITSPLRFASRQFTRIVNAIRLTPAVIRRGGGVASTLIKAQRVIRNEGLTGVKRGFRLAATHAFTPAGTVNSIDLPEKNDYTKWILTYDTLNSNDIKSIHERVSSFERKPVFSVIMPVYNPPVVFFDKAIQSVRDQLYPYWELCIADDASTDPQVKEIIERHRAEDQRIKVIYRSENGRIAKSSNSALELAQGEFIAMLDHDDAIPIHAFYLFAEEINKQPDLDFLYSDQDKIDVEDTRYDPYFKPDFNPDLLRSQNFVDHLAVFRTSIVKELNGWRTEFDGSQDYDLVLRYTERLPVRKIKHIPHVLYHWRAVPGSLAIDAGAKNYAPVTSRKALSEHLERMSVKAEVTSHFPHLSIHRVIYAIDKEPLVSIIIPTKDGVDILEQCVNGLLTKTDYQNFEIIIVNNQSEQPTTYAYFDRLKSNARVKILEFNEPFNYSKINNFAVEHAKGEVLALLNNDIEVKNSGWLREMVSHALRPEIGAVGARLYYPDGTVQHAGVLLGYKGKAGHMYRYASPDWLGYWARGVLIQNLTAVTAACMVLRKQVYKDAGGFDEVNFSVTFNDVDLCLRIHESGLRNLYTPYAELLHHESKTRGLLAHQSEEDYFAKHWQKFVAYDPAYNPNLSLEDEDFSIAWPPRVVRPWLSNQTITSNLTNFPLVSIITRTHGSRHEFLKQAIASIFSQTYRPIQIVIVEDGGNNMQPLVLSMLPPSGITIDYKALPKRGRSFAGNQGLDLARGDFFGFLDDDDLLLPNHVASLVTCLKVNPTAAAAYTSSWEIPTDIVSLAPLELTEGKKSLFCRSNWSLKALWDYNYIPIQALLLKRELYLKHGGLNENLECLEDWDLWLRYSVEADFVFLDQTTSEFRMPKNEATLRDRRDQHLQYLPILRQRQKELLLKYENTPYQERLARVSS